MAKKKNKKSKKIDMAKRRRINKTILICELIIFILFLIIAKCGPSDNSSNETTEPTKSEQQIEKVEPVDNIEEKEEGEEFLQQEVILSDELQVPLCGANHHAHDHELRKFKYYSICYRESYEQAEWSAYHVSAGQQVKNAKRTDDFRSDNKISTKSATPADYKKSGYDRGHLTPAADMAFDETAMSETFYMSNMSPQAPQFNRGIWVNLETLVREWTKKFGDVYVVSGPVLDKDASEYDSIGTNKVSVPEYYYKVVLVPKGNGDDPVTAIGFIIPNKKCSDSVWNYAVTVDEVEEITGLDFYSLLDDDIEDKIEAKLNTGFWK